MSECFLNSGYHRRECAKQLIYVSTAIALVIAAVAALEQACFSAPWSTAALEEELQGYRERTALCDALMAYVLFCGAKGETERTLPIGREALCDFLSRWESAVERSEEGYLIHFTKRQEAEHGAPCAAE